MAASESSSEGEDVRTCYRCDGPLGDAHEIRLTVAHQGVHAERYSDVDRQICLDCLAAIGLLEFELEGASEQQEHKMALRERLSPR